MCLFRYLDIWTLTWQVILFALAAVLVVAFGLLRNLLAALIILLVVTMIAVELLGCMSIAGILLNAISVVNIVVGIGVRSVPRSSWCPWVRVVSSPSLRLTATASL